ncbi:MAG: primosomal protein N', partial [Acetobacteraceae bacterium]|nr:primosomal protein N' [Acetobacteraceae bacterium]
MAGEGRKAARVLLPLPLADAYDYALPEGMAAPPGAFVKVPLGSRELVGVVWDGEATLPLHRLRPVSDVLDVPQMPEAVRRFVDWVAAYTISPPGAVLRMAMSVPSALDPAPPRSGWRLSE